MRRLFSIALLFSTVAALVVVPTPARAALVLNTTGTNLGFTLSTFVGGYVGNYGPLAQGILPNGNVLTGSLLNNKIYTFSDTDGQTLASALSSTPYACQTGNCNFSITTAAGEVYGAQASGGTFLHFANNGSSTPIPNLLAAGVTGYFGMWANPVNGHLIASSSKGLVDIDPVAGTFRVINAGLFPDGVTVSPDGLTAYVENGGAIQAYSIANGALLATYATGHSPDGTGVISGGTLNGDIIANNNDGTVGLLDPSKANGDPNQFRIIATGGTRGDFVSADLSNGTLFLSQQDQVARLSCGNGCSIGGPPPPTGTPEPATFGLLGVGLSAFSLFRRKSR